LGLCFLLDLLWYGFVLYYHAPLEPQHVLLGVHELDDVATELVAQLPHFLPYLGLIALAYGVAAVALQRLQPRTFHLSIAPALPFAVVLTEPALIYASNLDVRYYPSPARPPLSNAVRTLSIAAITAGERSLGGDPALEFAKTYAEPIGVEAGPLTVAVVMGESISGFRMHLLGAERQTTPRIEHWLDPSGPVRLIPRGRLAASPAPRATLPLFPNPHWHPRDIALSYERPANLFALAKRNRFQTYVYSVQRRHILMLGGLELVDSIRTVDERWPEYEKRRDD